MSTPSPTIAVLGLGIMGSRMARRLLEAGFPVVVFNRTADRAAPLVEAGARLARTPREAAARADVLVGMVADDGASRQVWLGEDGALGVDVAGKLVIESSTLSVGWIRELAAAATSRGAAFLDAPVTGSRNQAAAGELHFLVGGPVAAFERARPVLLPMSRSIRHLGPTGSGALAKLINNFVCATHVASFAEALAMIERSGLDRQAAVDVLLDGAPGSPIVRTMADRMISGDFTPNFMLRLLTKDVGYALSEARAVSLELTTAATALTLLERAVAAGHGGEDMAAAIRPLRGN